MNECLTCKGKGIIPDRDAGYLLLSNPAQHPFKVCDQCKGNEWITADVKSCPHGFVFISKCHICSGWIKVTDRLPDHLQMILGCSSSGAMRVVRCDLHRNGSEIIDYVFMSPDLKYQLKGITHWMTLPEPPV